MSITFQVKDETVEVLRDGESIACIRPGDPQRIGEDGNSISIVSRQLAGGWIDETDDPKLVTLFKG